VYHLGEMPTQIKPGEVLASADGTRKYTADGGVWIMDYEERYKSAEDVLNVDLNKFEVEQASPSMLGEMARQVAEKRHKGFFIATHYGTLVTRAVLEFGWEHFLLAAALDPKRLGEILDRFGAASLAVAEGWAQTEGVELIYIHDDIAGTRGVLLQPSWYETYVFPWYKRIFDAIHAQGRKVLYVSDGNWLPVADGVLATGADGVYIESSSMSPHEVMERVGKDKFYLLKSDSRNIDMGTPEEIYAEVRILRELQLEYHGILMYRGGGNPRPGNAEAFERAVEDLLIYER
jgi:hypothetical protein